MVEEGGKEALMLDKVGKTAKNHTIRCVNCERFFEPKRHDQRHCSKDCRIEYHKQAYKVGQAAIKALKGDS